MGVNKEINSKELEELVIEIKILSSDILNNSIDTLDFFKGSLTSKPETKASVSYIPIGYYDKLSYDLRIIKSNLLEIGKTVGDIK